MTDVRSLKTVSEKLPNVSIMTCLLSVTADLPVLDALEASSCHLTVALDVLHEAAANCTEDASQLYAVFTAVGIARGLLNSALTAIAAGGKEASHG